jgi:hypothetical protein
MQKTEVDALNCAEQVRQAWHAVPPTKALRGGERFGEVAYCFVALSMKLEMLPFSFVRSSSWRYIMWPAV